MAQKIDILTWSDTITGMGFEDGFSGLAGQSFRVNPSEDGVDYYTPATGGWVRAHVSYASLAAASTSHSILLYTLPAGGVIDKVFIAPTSKFQGGSISNYQVSIGVSGALQCITPLYSVDTNPSGDNFLVASVVQSFNYSAETQILITAQSVGANLSAATAGDAYVYLYVTNIENT